MGHYYYLGASLDTLEAGGAAPLFDSLSFFKLARRQLSAADFEQFRRLFFFQDFRNILEPDPQKWVFPAYYSAEELAENKEDTESFFPFIADFLRTSGQSDDSAAAPIDRLTLAFYNCLDETVGGFVRDYYLFTADLTNYCSALNAGMDKTRRESSLVKAGPAYEKILTGSYPDFGVLAEYRCFRRLADQWQKGGPLEQELARIQARWEWLDSAAGDGFFSEKAIFVYALKLADCERLAGLSPEKGQELFNDLFNIIKRTIRFSIEFSSRGDE